MESELKKLEDLLAGGFIVEAEFNARKADLITASAGGVVYTPNSFPLDVGRYFFDYAAHPDEPLQEGLNLQLVCRTWNKIGSRHPAFMCRCLTFIRKNKIKSNSFEKEAGVENLRRVLQARIPAKALSTIQLVEGFGLAAEYDLEPLFEIVGLLCLHAPKQDKQIVQSLIEQGTARVCNQFSASADSRARRGAVWCLSNFVIFKEGMAEFMQQPEALPRLLSILDRRPFVDQGTLRVTIWTIANLVGNSMDNRIKFFQNPSVIQSYVNFTKASISRYLAFASGTRVTSEDSEHLDFDVVEHSLRGLYSLSGRNAPESQRDPSHADQLYKLDVSSDIALPTMELVTNSKDRNRLLAANYALGIVDEVARTLPDAAIPVLGSPVVLGAVEAMRVACSDIIDAKAPPPTNRDASMTSFYILSTIWRWLDLAANLPQLRPASFNTASLTRLWKFIFDLIKTAIADVDDPHAAANHDENWIIDQCTAGLCELAASPEWSDLDLWLTRDDGSVQMEYSVGSEDDVIPEEGTELLLSRLAPAIGFVRYPNILPLFCELKRSNNPAIQKVAEKFLQDAIISGRIPPDAVEVTNLLTRQLTVHHINAFDFINKGFRTAKENTESAIVKKAIQRRVCTYAETGKTFSNQYYYRCVTCNYAQGEGCCVMCAQICHAGHQLGPKQWAAGFYCDCGSDTNKVCKAMPHDH